MTQGRAKLAIAVAAVAIAAAGITAASDDPSAVDRAQELAHDDDRFATATDASATFLRVASVLTDGGERCGDEREPRCMALFAAAAWAQVAAVEVAQCTRPGIFDARQALRGYLDRLDDEPTLETPPVPSCPRR